MRTKIQFAVVALALSFALALPSNNSLHAQQALAEVSVESKTIAPNSTSSVNISLSNGPDAGVAAIRGSLRFDPKVLKATKVEGQQDYEVFASKLDNNAGEVGFVVVKLRAPYAKAGPLIKIEFQAIGKSGDKSDLKLFLSEFRDPDDRNIPNKIINGLITLGAVQNQPPTANFSFTPAEPKVDEEISFKDESTDPDGATDIVSWEWDFGDGTTSTDQNPKKKYSQKKVYDVRLTVRDRGGLTNFVIKKVPVGIVPPKADFSFSPASPEVGDEVQFTDKSTDDGQIVSRQWGLRRRHQEHRAESEEEIHSAGDVQGEADRAGQRRRREHRREDYYSEALEPARRGGLPQSRQRERDVHVHPACGGHEWDPLRLQYFGEARAQAGEAHRDAVRLGYQEIRRAQRPVLLSAHCVQGERCGGPLARGEARHSALGGS
jgi:GH24 family phage-related lysozyme (muramidase)